MKIVIFWWAWSGTSTVWKMLAEKLGYTFMSTGDIFRQFAADAWLSVYEFEAQVASKDLSFDIRLDNETQKYGKENDKFVFESRLAWYFIPDAFKVYVDCDVNERYRRIHEREGWTIEYIKEKNTKRETGVTTRYNELYPDAHYPPEKTNFDLVVDSAKYKPHEIIDMIEKKIIGL